MEAQEHGASRSWYRAVGRGGTAVVFGLSVVVLAVQTVHLRNLHDNLQALNAEFTSLQINDHSTILSRNRRQSSVGIGSCAPAASGREGRDGRSGARGPIGPQGLHGHVGPPGVRGRPWQGLTTDELEKVLQTLLQKSESKTGNNGKKDKEKYLLPPGGVTYTRWGRTECREGTTLVYSGVVGGKYYNHAGGGFQYLCLPLQPEWGNFKDGFQSSSFMYGTEYEIQANNPFGAKYLHDNDAPCAICHVGDRGGHMMIPAWKKCPTNWTMEYSGYLMSSHSAHKTSSFVCVDSTPNVRDGSSTNKNGALWYAVEANCGSLPCPNYANGREITCAICTI